MQLNGETYYLTSEACRIAGISRPTFLRWVRDGKICDVELRDRKGWRLFSEDDVNHLVTEANRVERVITKQ